MKVLLNFLGSAGVACGAAFVEAAANSETPFSKKACIHALVVTAVVFAAVLKQSPLVPKVPS